MAEWTTCSYNYGRCNYSVLSRNSSLLRNHWKTKHAKEYKRERKRRRATDSQTMAMEGLRAVYAGQISQSEKDFDTASFQEVHMARIAEHHRSYESALSNTPETTFRLHTFRQFESPDPLPQNDTDFNQQAKPVDESDEDVFDARGTITEDEDADFVETEDVLSEMYGTQLDPGGGIKQIVSSEAIVEEENQGEFNGEFDVS